MRLIRRTCRALAITVLVGGLAATALGQSHDVCDGEASSECDCCQVANCAERHEVSCPAVTMIVGTIRARRVAGLT